MSRRLLERERELAELDALIVEAEAGAGRFAAIEAVAGLGKTRLLQAAREAGRAAGMRVLAARATELERDFPFALVRQLFEPALAALDAPAREALLDGAAGAARGALGIAGGNRPASATGDTFAVLHGLYWLTAALAEQRPLLLAVDLPARQRDRPPRRGAGGGVARVRRHRGGRGRSSPTRALARRRHLPRAA